VRNTLRVTYTPESKHASIEQIVLRRRTLLHIASTRRAHVMPRPSSGADDAALIRSWAQ
jgi:hypothetical protein